MDALESRKVTRYFRLTTSSAGFLPAVPGASRPRKLTPAGQPPWTAALPLSFRFTLHRCTMARLSKACKQTYLEKGAKHVEPPQLSILVVSFVVNFVPGRRSWPSLARQSLGATGIAPVEAPRTLALRPERRGLLARTTQAVSDSVRRNLPQQRHRRVEPRARPACGL